jgi:hypothetical protein
MIKLDNVCPQYITDEKGKKKSVILSISKFQELIEDIEDLAAVAERRDDPTMSRVETIGSKRAQETSEEDHFKNSSNY